MRLQTLKTKIGNTSFATLFVVLYLMQQTTLQAEPPLFVMPEICDNGIDDDMDGLIDCFDDDCFAASECVDFYYGGGASSCQFVPPVVPTFELELLYKTDELVYPIDQRCSAMVGDLDGDGIPEIIGKDPSPARIQIFNGLDGSIKQSITSVGNHPFSQVAIADADRNGTGDIFVIENGNVLTRYEYGNPGPVWRTANNIGDNTNQSTPQIADFNGDGVPEIYVGNRVFNSLDGTRLAIGSGSRGIYNSGDKYTIAFDVFQAGDPNPSGGIFGPEADGLELIAGNQVYTVELGNGTQDNGTLTVVSQVNVASLQDGLTSIADIDGDGEIDIAVVDSGQIYIWNPRTQAQIGSTYNIPNTDSGGRINIGDFDNDGMVEIGTAGRNRYQVLEYNAALNTLEVKWEKTGLDDGSQRTGSSLFDFEGDGSNEVVYREEGTLYVWRGADGAELAAIPTEAGTRTEYPMVADVNGDGAAEIILTGQNGNGPGFSGNGWVEVYRSRSTPWVAARPVWNQHGYFNVNINDDLTVPAVQQNPLNPSFNNAFNSFLTQSTILSNGSSPAFAAPDAVFEILSVNSGNCPDLELTVKIKNEGDATFPGVTPISFYDGDPTLTAANLIGNSSVGVTLAPGDSTTFIYTLDISGFPSPLDIFGVVNDPGFASADLPYDLNTDFPVTGTPECDFTNNISSALNNECLEICADDLDNDGDGFADEPNIFATQTTGCTGEALPQLTTDLPGGTWEIISSIGSSIDASGNVILGVNDSPTPDVDTVVYNLPECPDTLFISVFDDEAPTLVCPGDQINSVDGNCEFFLPDYLPSTTFSDNCNVSVVQSPTAGTSLPVGITTVTMTASDDAGNMNVCSFEVRVEDVDPPVVTCPTDITVSADVNCAHTVADYTGSVTVTDNCSAAVDIAINQFPPAGFVFDDPGTVQLISLEVSDENNQSTQCNFFITLEDTDDPTISCPMDMVFEADMMCSYEITDLTSFADINDNCASDAQIILTQTPLAGTVIVGDGSSTTVTLTADDGSGNTAQCSFDVSITDLTTPEITCPADDTQDLDNSCTALIPDFAQTAMYSDNCLPAQDLTVTQSPSAGTPLTGHNTTQTVTLSASDTNGNTSQCDVILTLEDNSDPEIICPSNQDITVNGSCQIILPDYTGDASVSDNCTPEAGITVSQIPAIGTFISGAGTVQPIILTANDGNGNFISCGFSITLRDESAPSITCPTDITLNLDEDCQVSLPDYTGATTITDNCTALADINISQSPTPGTFITANQLLTITADDGNGNARSCTFTVNVEDIIPPQTICPSDTSVEADSNCEISLADYTSITTASDNCSAPSAILLSQSPSPGTVFTGHGTTQVVNITAEDEAGNTAQCDFTIEITDTNDPVIICPAAQQLVLDAACQVSLPDYTSAGTVSDNCTPASAITVSQSPSAGTVFSGHGQINSITLTADDGNGNTASCSFNIVLNDETDPVPVCPPNDDLTLDANCEIVIPDYRTSTTATDNCAPSVAINFTQSPAPGTVLSGLSISETITVTANDGNGNSGSCTLLLTGSDTSLPDITCPADITFDVDGNCDFPLPDLTTSATATDNCSNPSNITITQSPAIGTVLMGDGATALVTLTAEDETGNTAQCDFTLTINDATLPSLICPADQTEITDSSCDFPLDDYTSMATVSDNCANFPSLNLSQSPLAGTVISGFGTSQLVTITADDGFGNVSTCDFNVILSDAESPSITCPSNFTQNITDGNCQYTLGNFTNSATVSDNCTPDNNISVTQDPVNGTVLVGHNTVQTVTLTADDGNGNTAQCTFDITLNDAILPQVTCPANQNVLTDESCNFTLANYTNETIATDNCTASGNIILTQSPSPGTVVTGHSSVQTVTITANDTNGNTRSCSFDITLNDNLNPMISCPSPQVQNTTTACEASLADYTSLAVLSDNCTPPGTVAVSQSPTAGFTLTDLNQATTVTLTADDGNGNTEQCTFEVALRDTIAPTLTCPSDDIIVTDSDCRAVVGDYTTIAVGSDNCTGTGQIIITQTPVAGTTLSGHGVQETVTLTASDEAGNQVQCTLTVELNDTEAPQISCPSNQDITLDNNCRAVLANYLTAVSVSDNCAANGEINLTQSPAPGFIISGNDTSLPVTIQADDGNGNINDCTFTVNFIDNTPPGLTCPGFQTEFLNASCNFILPDYSSTITVIDECADSGGLVVSQSPVAGTNYTSPTILVVTMTVGDDNGNTRNCDFTINIEDASSPDISCPNDQFLTLRNCSITVPDYSVGLSGSDECGIPDGSIVQTPAAGTVIDSPGVYNVTFTVTDSNDNVSTCSFALTVSEEKLSLPVQTIIRSAN